MFSHLQEILREMLDSAHMVFRRESPEEVSLDCWRGGGTSVSHVRNMARLDGVSVATLSGRCFAHRGAIVNVPDDAGTWKKRWLHSGTNKSPSFRVHEVDQTRSETKSPTSLAKRVEFLRKSSVLSISEPLTPLWGQVNETPQSF